MSFVGFTSFLSGIHGAICPLFVAVLRVRHNGADVNGVTRVTHSEPGKHLVLPPALRRAPLLAGIPRSKRVQRASFATAFVVVMTSCSLHPSLEATPPDPSASTKVMSSDGVDLAVLDRGERREPVPLAQIAQVLQDAVVAIEDHRFFEHSGVDLRAVVRALREDVKSGAAEQGGSTITQQYVRRVLLTNEKSVERKVREAVLAIELERKYSKQEILERYLNEVYYGDGAYGIEVAAQKYFGTRAAQLTLAQSALLAGLLQSPERLNPRHNVDAARKRRNDVLAAMNEHGYITDAIYRKAIASAVVLAQPKPTTRIAPYYVEAVRRWFLNNPAFGESEADRANLLYRGGLTITTALDTKLQARAEASIDEVLNDPANDPAAALVTVRPKDGAVLSYVGGRGMAGPESYAQFDLAGSMVRPNGSTFKPFVLAAALERHIPLSKQFDAPAQLTLTPKGTTPWTIHNYDDKAFGRIDLLDATVHSVNTVYSQLMLEVGPEYAVEVAKRLGITTPLQPYACAVLGCNNVSPLDVASAYATLAADGMHNAPYMVTRVTDRSGRELYKHVARPRRAIAAGIARTVNHTLEQVVTRGTGINARIGRPVAGKTGTTDDYADAWFAGSTPQITTVVWVGSGSTPQPMVPPRTRIKVTGGAWPTQIWARFMSFAVQSMPVAEFPAVSESDAAGVLPSSSLPAVVGMPNAQATQLLTNLGYVVVADHRIDANYPPGTVTAQTPEARTATRAGATVTITIAHPIGDSVQVPAFLGLTEAEAISAAQTAGIQLEFERANEPPPSNAARTGRIWKQSAASTTTVVRDSVVRVTINR